MTFWTKQRKIPPCSAFFAMFLHKIENLPVAFFLQKREICFFLFTSTVYNIVEYILLYERDKCTNRLNIISLLSVDNIIL